MEFWSLLPGDCRLWGKRPFKVLHFFLMRNFGQPFTPEDGSVRPQTLGKRVSDDSRRFIPTAKTVFDDLFFDVCVILRVLIGIREMSHADQKKRLDWSTGNALIGTQDMS